MIERLLIIAAAVALSIGVIALLSGGLLADRDAPGVAGSAAAAGVAYPDQGDARLPAGRPHPPYDSDPPTSGPHVPEPVRHDRAALGEDQLLSALAAGDVVLMYGTSSPPPGLVALARSAAPPFSPALAASGQAAILARRPGTAGIIALAWAHMLRVATPGEPDLRAFTRFWLGRGAPTR